MHQTGKKETKNNNDIKHNQQAGGDCSFTAADDQTIINKANIYLHVDLLSMLTKRTVKAIENRFIARNMVKNKC